MQKYILFQIAMLLVAVTSAALKSFFDTKPRNLNSVLAIQHITRSFMLQRTNTLTIAIEAENRSILAVFGEMVDDLLKHLDYAKVQMDGTDTKGGGYRLFNIVFVDGFDAFKHVNLATKTKNYDINELYLIYLGFQSSREAYYSEMKKILTYCWSHYIINISILVEESSQVSDLYTYLPFSESQCRKAEPILINRFINGALTDDCNWIFPKKLQNLCGCSLTAALWDTPPYFRISPNETGLEKFIDFEGILLRVLAKKLNFSLEYVVPPNDEQRGIRFPNGTTNGAMKLLEDRIADLSLGSFRYTMERCETLTGALPYYQTWQVFGVLKTSLPYTSIEILMFPFQTSTWLSLLAFIGITISFRVLAVSYRTIFGGCIFGDFLNALVASLLGVSIARLPSRNFTRYLLTMWIIFTFVMRSAYQSLLFQLLRSNLYRKPPNNIEELVDRDYTLIMTEGTYNAVHTVPKIFHNQIKYLVTDNSSELSTFEFVEHTTGRFAGVAPMDFLTYYVMTQSQRGMFHILPQKIFTQHVSIYFTKHSFLIERFNELLMNLRGSGLIDFWAKQRLDLTYFEEVESLASAKTPMNLNQLSGMFDVYLVLNLVALFVFLLEICSKRVIALKKVLGHLH